MGMLGDASGRRMDVTGRRPRAIAVAAAAIVASATVAVGPPTNAVHAASGDFSIDLVAAAPESYNHLTGGGAYDDRTVGVDKDIVESLEGGDYACGDIVTYFTQVVVDDVQSADDDGPQTIEMDFSFLADTTGQSGVAIGDIVDVKVNYGTIEDLIPGENTIDDGIDDDGGSVATLTSETLTGPLFQAGSELLGTVELTDLDRAEKVVVRIDVKLFCDPGSNPTGNLQGALEDARLTFVDDTTAVIPPQAISGGAQTIPFKQIGNIAVPEIDVVKTVTTATGTCPGVEILTVTSGDTVKYCYVVSEVGGEAPLYNVALEDDNGTPGDTSDDFFVALSGLTDVDGDGDADDLAAGGSASGEAFVTLTISGSVVNTATASGDDAIIQPTTLTDTDTAEVVVNDPDFGTIVIVKDAVGGVETFDFTGDWADVQPGGSFQITTAGTGAATTGSVTYTDVFPDSYTVAETTPTAPWSLTSLSCTDTDANGTDSAATSANTAAINLDPGETVVCTFTNTRDSATLTVDKTWVNAVVNDAVGISVNGINDDSGPSVAETASETDFDVAGTTVYVGETVALDETFTTGSAANYTESLTCVYGQSDTTIAVTNGSITIPAPAKDETIRCEFTNTRNSATLTLEKAWVDGEQDDTAVIGIDGTNDDMTTATAAGTAGTDVSADTASTTVLSGETVTLSEVLGAGNAAAYQTTLECGGTPVTLTGLSGTYTVPADPDAVTCRFTNSADRGTIVIVKNALGATGTFDYTGDWADVLPGGTFQITTTGAGTSTGSVTYPGVLAGTYDIAEVNPQPAWDLTSLVCSDSNPQGAGSSPNPANQQLAGTIELDAGETVTCTFTNTKRGSITVVKDVTNTADGTDPNVFDFTFNSDPFTLADNGTAGANTTTFPNLVAGDYTITETDANANGFSLDSIDCGNATTTDVTDGVRVTLGVAEAATCTFVNKAEADLSITKTAVTSPVQPVSVGGDTFTVAYDVVVTNNGPGATTYDLADTPDFGTGATITEVAVSSAQLAGSPVIDPTNPIVADESIAGSPVEAPRTPTTS